ncbi:MAG: hypothetical protein KatS3mg109_0637 [Pirellulaceae bacterium]|nr:MAG: hypothetical protein KatS3mg109_0637 [Pirellulaceae bacterium]GIW93460.1 MAG: hypothetical protein KatS3mg110_1501 [Pirellulaceae bacterium]
MKWHIFLSTVVLGVALCSQSYGFDLLDRMLGLGGCGCETKCCTTKSSCAAKPAGCEAKPAGCAAKPACGCEAKPAGCAAKPAGCAAKPACGCEAKPAGCAAKPACGAEKACGVEAKCRQRCRPNLLERIFSCHRCGCHDRGCAGKNGCGCEAKAACGCDAPAKADGEMAPMPPAPIVDPSAYIPAQRHVVAASATLIR